MRAAVPDDPGPDNVVVSFWQCPPCEVGGSDLGRDPICWNCGLPAVTTAATVRPAREYRRPAA